MKASAKRPIQVLLLILCLFVIGVAVVQAQDEEEESQPEALRLDDRPRVRIVNASPELSSADVYIDGGLFFQAVSYRQVSAYLPLPALPGPQTHKVQVRPGGQSEGDFVTGGEHSFEPGKDYTVLIVNGSEGIDAPWVIEDVNEQALPPGRASVRLVRAASPALPPVELCVDERCGLLTTEQKVTNYIETEAGSYNVDLRMIANEQLFATAWPVTFTAGEVHSIFLFDPQPEQVSPQLVAYIDTAQQPAGSQPSAGPGLPAPVPPDGGVAPPAYPPVTGAFLSPTALATVVVIFAAVLLAGGWMVWQLARKRAGAAVLGRLKK